MAPFDENDPLQAPTHERGSYVRTEDVTRLDLRPLPPEPLAPENDHRGTTRWRAAAEPSPKGAGGNPADGRT